MGKASAPAHAPYLHPCGHIRTAIPGSLRYTTTMDGGSADIAGANICPSIHGHKKSPPKRAYSNYSYYCYF